MKNRMPKNWDPPYPGHDTDFGDNVNELTIAYYGIQSIKKSSTSQVDVFVNWFKKASGLQNGPKVVERAKYVDNEGFENKFFIAYWNNNLEYQNWEKSDFFQKYWNNDERLHSDVGIWREVLRIPRSRFETVFSSKNEAGAAKMCSHFTEPVKDHAYWGAMRDRIPESKTCPFHSTVGESLSSPVKGKTTNNRVFIKPPENLAIIRSGQNYTDCKKEELDYYQEHIVPALHEGMEYIGTNPLETGCCINRFSTELDENWNEEKKTFGAAYFISLEHLEKWAEHHPTHLKIFGKFFGMAQHFNLQLDLKLWHEVSVLPKDNQLFEYVNCHPMTGFLPWFTQTKSE